MNKSADAAAGTLFGRPPDQIAYVVADLEQAVRLLDDSLALSAWRGWVFDAAYLPMRIYAGEPGQFVSRVATSGAAPQIEVVEPIEGPSVFFDFLDRRGPGLHHVGYFVESFEPAKAHLERAGLEEIQGGGGHGVDGDGRFGIFQPQNLDGVLIEISEPPRRRGDPHFIIGDKSAVAQGALVDQKRPDPTAID